MRILLLHNQYQHLGGEDTVVRQEAEVLSRCGHEVLVLTDKNRKGLSGLIQYGMYPFNLITANHLMEQVERFRPDVVHLHNLHYAVGPMIIRKLKKKGYPVIMTLHNFRLICPSATLFYNNALFTASITESFPWTAVRKRVLENSLLKTLITAFTYWSHRKLGTWNSVDRYFTFSHFAKDIFVRSKLGVNKEKFIIKPNFSEELLWSSKKFEHHFVYIGRLSSEKGILQLLQAISKTNHAIRIFGDGPLRAEIEHFSAKYPNIHYLGFQHKDILQEEVKNANALIVPSVCYEGMPMGIIEAFATGTPVLCSNIGILEQMVVPLFTGLHFEPDIEQSIIHCLDTWSSLDQSTKQIISNNCIDEFHKKYTADHCLSILEEVYHQIIEENEHSSSNRST